VAYLLQSGIAEWDANTVYFNQSSFCTRGGVIFQSTADNNLGNDPAVAGNPWQTLASQFALTSPGAAKAWVYFSGSTGAILASYNVTNVAQLGTGNFLISFPGGLLADANYCALLSTSNDNAAPYDPFTRLNGDTKTPTQLQVRNLNGNTLAGWGGNAENYVAIFR
jgi:hypothetical protein